MMLVVVACPFLPLALVSGAEELIIYIKKIR
jgi:hypothetical protein